MEPSTGPAEQASNALPGAALKEKKFRCKHCGREFARLEHLQRHERIHTGHKPFACAECNHAFTRSDLLTRHEKIKHNKQEDAQKSPNNTTSNATSDYYGLADQQPPRKRSRTCSDVGGLVPDLPSMMSPPTPLPVNACTLPPLHPQPLAAVPPTPPVQGEELSLAALSMAAEYQSMRSAPPAPPAPQNGYSRHIPLPGPGQMLLDSIGRNTEQPADSVPAAQAPPGPSPRNSLDSLASFLEHDTLSTYHFSTVFNTEQPMPFFSPEALQDGHNTLDPPPETLRPSRTSLGQNQVEDLHSFSRFGSRLPSLQPETSLDGNSDTHRPIAEISLYDRLKIQDKLKEFAEVLPSDFKLPSRLAFCRYIAAYVSGFHEHMPFLHIPSMSIDTCSIELVLAMAAVGAQYTFEGERGVELFRVSQAVATYRIRRRDARVVAHHRRSESDVFVASDSGASPPTRGSPRKSFSLGIPAEAEETIASEDLMQTAQALLLLMALCTWAKHKEILREALAIQSLLATLIRDDGLQLPSLAPDSDIRWRDWLHRETTKRTKFIVYGFSNLHCIVYSIPPFILTSEVQLPLPCATSEFKAATEQEWREARKRNSKKETQFQDALQTLFSKHGRDVTAQTSSAGNYALIHALIQQIFFVRQVSRGRFSPSGSPGDISADDISALENALRNWQAGWKLNPESSLDPVSPNGPVAFNSTALLRLAYIRLYVDTASRSLDSRDPVLIAHALRDGPAIKRSPKITRAVLHSAHALSIPIKIGYRLVAKTQSFVWSIQHSLCTLECAYLLSKWFEALSVEGPDTPVTEDERRIVEIVKSMLDETEFALPEEDTLERVDSGLTGAALGANGSPRSPLEAALAESTNMGTTPASAGLCQPASLKRISAGVLRVWATIFKGNQTWAIVDVIGSALNLYADMLEAG